MKQTLPPLLMRTLAIFSSILYEFPDTKEQAHHSFYLYEHGYLERERRLPPNEAELRWAYRRTAKGSEMIGATST